MLYWGCWGVGSVLGGGVVVVVLVGLDVPVGEEQRGSGGEGATDEVGGPCQAAVPLDGAIPAGRGLWRSRQDAERRNTGISTVVDHMIHAHRVCFSVPPTNVIF